MSKEFFTEIQRALFLESPLFGPISQIIRTYSSLSHYVVQDNDSSRVLPNGTHNNNMLNGKLTNIFYFLL